MRTKLFTLDTALLTTRCVVRRFREGDGKAFYRLIDDNRDHLLDHFPFLVAEAGQNRAKAEGFVRRALAAWLLQQRYAFAIWDNETTDLIGFIQLADVEWDIPKAEVHYFLDREQVEKGIMTEVLARVVRFAFKQLELEKLYVLTLSDNYGSHRLVRRIGFSREGDLRNEFRKPGGGLVDVIRFGLSRETYAE